MWLHVPAADMKSLNKVVAMRYAPFAIGKTTVSELEHYTFR